MVQRSYSGRFKAWYKFLVKSTYSVVSLELFSSFDFYEIVLYVEVSFSRLNKHTWNKKVCLAADRHIFMTLTHMHLKSHTN